MRRLYIDFDGVVMDTIPLLYNELEKIIYHLGYIKVFFQKFIIF